MEFKILGPFEVLDEGGVVSIAGAKERSLLALLLLHGGRVVSTDRLIDSLWGEEPPDTARKSLQVRVAGLRKALGQDRIVTSPSGYRVSLERPDALDLERFERLAAVGDAESLREALSLWRGPALVDFAREPWAVAPAARLEEIRLAVTEKRVDADLMLGRHAELVGELEELVVAHPLRERFRGQLILSLYRSGRQAEALEAYRASRRALVDELGIEPGHPLQELERAILRQDRSLDLEPPPPPVRSILVIPVDELKLNVLVALAGQLAVEPQREVILMRPVDTGAELAGASKMLLQSRERLLADGIAARVAAFTSSDPGRDAARFAAEQDVDLLLTDGSSRLLEEPLLAELFAVAPCDVGALIGGEIGSGPVLVPFTGAEHDWSAVEVGVWLARTRGVRLVLAGPSGEERDASQLLARASLAVQRALGVAAEPLLVEAEADDLLRATEQAGLVVAGLTDRWRQDGVGPVRSMLAERSQAPVLLVRRGLRPGGLAPLESYTRFTWSLRPAPS
jgi:DNA-binding SARP family transcriptional activator